MTSEALRASIREVRNLNGTKLTEEQADQILQLIVESLKGQRHVLNKDMMPYAAGQANGWNDYRDGVIKLLGGGDG